MEITIEPVKNGYIISDTKWASKKRVFRTLEEALQEIVNTLGKNVVVGLAK